MSPKDSEHKSGRRRTIVRDVAITSIGDLLEPLAGFALDAGLSANELESLLRLATVKCVANRQREINRRVNISGIAASTGISRSEISRLLKVRKAEGPFSSVGPQATNRILRIWHYDPRYTNSNGQPADLRIFGSGPTFDSLVRRHGGGIPTRAILDELARTESIEMLDSERVRAKTLFSQDRGVTAHAVRAFGLHATALMKTLLANMRNPSQFQFISSIEGPMNSEDSLPLLRREVSSKGSEFLAMMRDRFFHDRASATSSRISRGAGRVSITVFLHENTKNKAIKSRSATTRRNLRRVPKTRP